MKLFSRLFLLFIVLVIVMIVISIVSYILFIIDHLGFSIASEFETGFNVTDAVSLVSKYSELKNIVVTAVDVALVIALIAAVIALFIYSRRR